MLGCSVNKLSRVAVSTLRSQRARQTHLQFTKCSTGNGPLSPLEVAQAEHQKTLKKTLSG